MRIFIQVSKLIFATSTPTRMPLVTAVPFADTTNNFAEEQ
jgi:hypothetical protein